MLLTEAVLSALPLLAAAPVAPTTPCAPGAEVVATAFEHPLRSAADEMIDLLVPGSVTTQPGSNPSTGAYFLVVICSRETQDGALKELEQQAREEIASFLGAKVSSKSSASTGSNYTEVEGKEAVEYFQTISKSTEVEIDQVIAGQVLVSMKRSSTSCSVAYAVTEKDAQRTKDLARAMARREEIGAVTGVGVAIDRGEGEVSALQIAERRAVENAVRSVAGVSMTSRELRVNGDVVARAAREYSSGSIGQYEIVRRSYAEGVAQVEVLAEVEPEGLVKDVRKHLELLGMPRIAVKEVPTWPAGRGPAYSVSPFMKGFERLASELKLPLSADDPDSADYLIELRPEWREMKPSRPIPGRRPTSYLKLYGQGEIIDRATRSKKRFDFPDPELHSVRADAIEAHQQLADRFWRQPQNNDAIRGTITEWLADFQANGRIVRVVFPRSFEQQQEVLQGALEQDGVLRNVQLSVEDEMPVWTCRTQFSAGDLASRIRYHAATQLGLGLESRSLQQTEIVFK